MDRLKQALENQEVARSERKKIGHVYHPYDPLTGKKQDAQTVESLLGACFSMINKATACLSKKCRKHIDKAHRVVSNFVSTIAFFYAMVDQHLENKDLTKTEREVLQDNLIPGFYLGLVAKKEKDKIRKKLIQKKSIELLSVTSQKDGPLAALSPPMVDDLIKIARECAHFFQRSSSSVEGRNAQLSLRHHGIHRLSERHLKAQTV